MIICREKLSQKASESDTTPMDNELDDVHLNTDPVVRNPRATMVSEQTQFQPPCDGGSKTESGQET